MDLTQCLHRHRRQPEAHAALVCGEQRRSYPALASRVARLAAALQAAGVVAGERVAVLSANSIECIEAFFACWWMGAVACPVNTRWSVPEIVDSLADCTPRLLLTDSTHRAVAQSLGTAVPVWLLGGGDAPGLPSCEALIDSHAPIDDGRYGGDHLAMLLYTGGTTGRSKGVMLTHRNLYLAALCRQADGDSLVDSVSLLATPLFHVAALTRCLPHLFAGGTTVVLPSFRPEVVLDLIEREGVTDAPFVPSMLQMLLDHPSFRPERMKSVRRLSYGAAPSAQALLERAQRELPWAGLYQYYGMTESGAIGTLSRPGDHDDAARASGRSRSAGQVNGVIEVRIVDESGRELPAGEVGEIVSRGPTVMSGYWNRPEETAHALRDGWLHTGDAGRFDEHGYLYVVDRIKDMIVTGGENVYSAEVENVLAQHPSVAQCAVIGIPDERWGEAVHAVVVLRDGMPADEGDLRAHCRDLLAHYKCPKSVAFRSELPMTAAGKVAKNVLRRLPH